MKRLRKSQPEALSNFSNWKTEHGNRNHSKKEQYEKHEKSVVRGSFFIFSLQIIISKKLYIASNVIKKKKIIKKRR